MKKTLYYCNSSVSKRYDLITNVTNQYRLLHIHEGGVECRRLLISLFGSLNLQVRTSNCLLSNLCASKKNNTKVTDKLQNNVIIIYVSCHCKGDQLALYFLCFKFMTSALL